MKIALSHCGSIKIIVHCRSTYGWNHFNGIKLTDAIDLINIRLKKYALIINYEKQLNAEFENSYNEYCWLKVIYKNLGIG